MLDLLSQQLTLLDMIAFSWFLICNMGYSYVTSSKRLSSNNIINALYTQRQLWMKNMASRESRLVDIQIMHGFTQGNGFFATTSVLVLGALAAVLASGESARAFMDTFPFTVTTPLFLWQIKLCLLLGIFVIAFFKFVWAYRLSNYASIAIGATPSANIESEKLREIQYNLAARLANLAARHSYVGLRSYYFAIAAVGWFIHPIAFMLSTTWIILVLYRREYLSRSAYAIDRALRDYQAEESALKNATDH